MAVDQSEIEKIAELARIHIEDADIHEVTARISGILELVDQMQTIDTSAVQPMAHPLDAQQRLRADEITESDQKSLFQAMAPAVQDGLYLVPRVIE